MVQKLVRLQASQLRSLLTQIVSLASRILQVDLDIHDLRCDMYPL